MPDRSLTKHQAAVLLGFHPETLEDQDFRRRIGLPAVRIGRHLRFLESDLKRVIERGREHFEEQAPEKAERMTDIVRSGQPKRPG